MADDKEKSLKERFTQDLKTARDFMEPIHQAMDRNYEMYRNRWQDDDCDVKVSSLYTYTETVVPILTNSRVRASIHSDYPEYIQHAKGLNDILDNTYDINDWDYQQQKVARMAEIYRSSIAYTGWDAEYKNKTGKLCITPINIRWCYIDPGAVEFEESNFFFYVEPKRKSQVTKMYPKKKQEIEDSLNKRSGSMSTGNGTGNSWFRTWVNAFKNMVAFDSDNKRMQRNDYNIKQEMTEEQKHKNNVAFIHYWYRDDDDKWRVSFWADEVMLEDTENPFWHERLPYDIYSPTGDILSTLGIPISEQIENLNWEKNAILQYVRANAELHADPPMMYNTTAGIKDPQALREKAKETGMIPVNNPDMVPLNALAEYVQVPTMPNYVVDLPDRYGAMEDRITGVNDSFRGMSEATSGKEVQLKQEAAYTRIKTKIDAFERFNKSIAEKILVNSMQYYKETRAFRIKGDYTKYQNIMEQPDQAPFEVRPMQTGTNPETNEPIYDRSEFFMYANPNEWTRIVEPQEGLEAAQPQEQGDTREEAQEAFKILQMTVEIEAGSSLPVSRMARKEEAIELGQAGYLDQEAVLESFDWPDRDDIIKRMQEAAKAQQDAQMQMQQQQQNQQLEAQAQQKQAELEAKAQAQAQDQQHQADMAQVNNEAKMQQVTAKSQEQAMAKVQQVLQKIRQQVPEASQLTDEQLIQLFSQSA